MIKNDAMSRNNQKSRRSEIDITRARTAVIDRGHFQQVRKVAYKSAGEKRHIFGAACDQKLLMPLAFSLGIVPNSNSKP